MEQEIKVFYCESGGKRLESLRPFFPSGLGGGDSGPWDGNGDGFPSVAYNQQFHL